MPRKKSFNEEMALRQALELFWAKGYEATSLSDLTQTLNIGKGSFYDTFGSKRELFDKCLALYENTSFQIIDKILLEKSEPKIVIRNMLNNHANLMLRDPKSKGCLIANSTAELADDSEIRTFLLSHNNIMRSKLRTLFVNSPYADQTDGMIDLILMHMTGISMMSKFVSDPERFHKANDLFMKQFESYAT